MSFKPSMKPNKNQPAHRTGWSCGSCDQRDGLVMYHERIEAERRAVITILEDDFVFTGT